MHVGYLLLFVDVRYNALYQVYMWQFPLLLSVAPRPYNFNGNYRNYSAITLTHGPHVVCVCLDPRRLFLVRAGLANTIMLIGQALSQLLVFEF